LDIECSICGKHFPEGTPDSVIKAHMEMHYKSNKSKSLDENKRKKKDNDISFGSIEVKIPNFRNPLLLEVKMLLAEMRVWINQYDLDNYNCVDFSKEIISRMVNREIRCGFVEIHFNEGNGHAIVAFETDHGLVFIEPQSGEQVDVIVGKHYYGNSQGVSDNPIITDYEITWNS
jgi:hypothetical protein